MEKNEQLPQPAVQPIKKFVGFLSRTLKALVRAGANDANLTELRSSFANHIHEAGQVAEQVRTLLNINHQTQMRQDKLVREIAQLADSVGELRNQIVTAVDRLEQRYAANNAIAESSSDTDSQGELSAFLDDYYWRFEEHFRGTREQIRDRLSVYQPFIAELATRLPGSQLIDVGCGRGEWLDLVAKWGVPSRGVDTNARMIKECSERGLNSEHGDAFEYLRKIPSGSLGAVTGFHIVEHLPINLLFKLLNESYRTLKPGGFVIFETPNPENLAVGSCDFYTDPTHRNPIPPHSLGFIMGYVGFKRQECLRLGSTSTALVPSQPDLAALVQRLHIGPDYAIVGFKDALEL
jgi:O-antigen chain-terminating methyltransferase